ncbi:VOC family protein [Aquabacter spiritensis]|uniref:Glyoxalase-like protein n=1 Tax=Aquabacter spiritensis TaxID=933073 RepID=A0A4R3M094_9HYPH|nr:VOC family protein [Aquabacter spiritensis]TCT06123.1 glyoxalase-like protein [Aquabacter spiritensis]
MPRLDHVVVNTLKDMPAAAAVFAALGFTLTPLGRHSLGSINHLMMTPGPYLELVGVPEAGLQRQEVLDSPFGLNGLVFTTDNADATCDRLRAAGLPATDPVAFSRPVEIDGEVVEARFRTVRLPAALVPAGRVYFCQHLTPDYVWRPEWLTHPNGFRAIDRFQVASRDPASDARLFALLCDAPAETEGSVWRVDGDGFRIEIEEGPAPRFVTFDLVFDSLDEIARRAGRLPGAVWQRLGADAARLALPAFDLTMECRSIR